MQMASLPHVSFVHDVGVDFSQTFLCISCQRKHAYNFVK
jgi:hypothetical protein